MINGYVFLAATLPMIAVSSYKNPAPTPIRSPKRASDWISSLPLVTVRIQPIITADNINDNGNAFQKCNLFLKEENRKKQCK